MQFVCRVLRLYFSTSDNSAIARELVGGIKNYYTLDYFLILDFKHFNNNEGDNNSVEFVVKEFLLNNKDEILSQIEDVKILQIVKKVKNDEKVFLYISKLVSFNNIIVDKIVVCGTKNALGANEQLGLLAAISLLNLVYPNIDDVTLKNIAQL